MNYLLIRTFTLQGANPSLRSVFSLLRGLVLKCHSCLHKLLIYIHTHVFLLIFDPDIIGGNDGSGEPCAVDTVAEGRQEVLGESDGRVTRLEMRMYIEADQQGVIAFT